MIFSAVLPLSISGWWTIKLVRNENTQRINLLLSSSAQNLSDAIYRYVIANVNSVKASIKDVSPDNEDVLRNILDSFDNINFISVNGISVGTTPRSINEYGDGIFLEKDSILFSSDKLRISLSIEPILKIIYSFSIGKTGTAHLDRVKADEPISKILEFEKDGRRYISSYNRIRDSDFAVFVSIEKNEVDKIWQNILYQIIFWIAVGVVLAFVSAFFISSGIVTPLKKISEVAIDYAKLNFSKKLFYEGKDEIKDVTRAFSVMSDEIQKAWEEIKMWNQELERRVEERTLQLKKTHDNLLVAEKIAAVGTLGAGVAHEINNPLAASLGFVQILKRKIQDEQLKKYFESIFNNLNRVRVIVEKLRNFSEIQMKANYKQININEIIRKVVEDMQDFIQEKGKDIKLNLQQVPDIYSDDEHFGSAIYELLRNAVFASDKTIEIRSYKSENNVVVEIEDDGKEGIPQEIINRIFEPFFTLKKWDGIGLGLTIARTIVQNIRGNIEVVSSPGKTVFKVLIDIDKNRELGEFLREEVSKIRTHLV
ncbi:MAG: ATP-binding protein [Candidatus Calescibacterium sp.]|nr:ATP-binding protein [Candidatus Calescibacterium sp.]